MPEQVLNLIKGDTVGVETDYRDALPVNMTAVSRPILGAAGYMIQSPGLTQYGSSSGVSRGAIWNERQGRLYRVQGGELISVDSSGSVEVLGAISGSDTVSMPYSFNTQGIIADGRFWLYDEIGGLREVTDPDLGNPISGVWVDGYYFFTDGEYLYHTDITSESDIDPLKFATAEFMPDPTLAVSKTQDNKVMVFGRYSIEYFINDASGDFSFRRVASRAIKIGIVGTHCQVEQGGKRYILGGRKEESVSVHVVNIGGATKVATREVDKLIGKYSELELSTVVVEAFSEDAYSYVLIHLPNETLQFNETVAQSVGPDNAWSILKSDVEGDDQWRAKHLVNDPRAGRWVVGDKLDGRLGFLDDRAATHYGELAEWLLYTPFTKIERGSIDDVEIEIIPGFTASDDATVFLSFTSDGNFYGNERTLSYGRPGDYGRRFIAFRLGYVRDWFGLKLRGASRSRMAFGRAVIHYG